MKTLVVVSGGDAPGINTTLYHVAEHAAQHGDSLIGAVGGLPAILSEHFIPLDVPALVSVAALGGSLLKSSRDAVLKDDSNRARLGEVLRQHAIDNLILFGGGGTLKYIPPIFTDLGIAYVGIPTTIDNDVPMTDLTLGFHSACDFAYPLIDGIRATGNALGGRLFTFETLGGDSGNLALAIAHGAGADGVILPEYPDLDDQWIADRLRAAIARKGHALLVYNEYILEKNQRLDRIAGLVGGRLRDTRLGHAQRGGSPVHMDRVLAREWAQLAIHALKRGVQSSITVWRDGKPVLHEGALSGAAPAPDPTLYRLINGLSA